MNNKLNNRHQLGYFEFDESNKSVLFSAMEAADNPGKGKCNPLFIYSESGMGKTHLLQGIGLRLQENEPDLVVIYTSADAIVDELIESLRDGKHAEFIKKYRQCDALLIDDVQSLSGKNRTQDEIFYILNDLLRKKRQVVVTCNVSPMELEGFNDNLLSILNGGVVVDIKKPDKDLLKIILERNPFHPFDQDLWEDEIPKIIDYIVEHFNDNTATSLGALNRVLRYCELVSEPINLDTAKDILEGPIMKHESEYEPMDMEEDLFLLTASELERLINKEEKNEGIEDLIEDMATVYIMLEKMKNYFNISDHDIEKRIRDEQE